MRYIYQFRPWAVAAIVSLAEILIQSLICDIEQDWSLNNIWFVIAWTSAFLVSILMLLIIVIKIKNQGGDSGNYFGGEIPNIIDKSKVPNKE